MAVPSVLLVHTGGLNCFFSVGESIGGFEGRINLATAMFLC